MTRELLLELERNEEWFETRFDYLGILEELSTALNEELDQLADHRESPTVEIPDTASVIGRVWIEEGAEILPGSVIEGPAIVRSGARIGPNAYLRDGVLVGADAVVGFNAEVKASVVLAAASIWHVGYVGHSIVGRRANIGAGFISAVKRLDGDSVRFGEVAEPVGPKGGVLIGNGARVGVGVLAMPGTVVGPDEIVLPDVVLSGAARPARDPRGTSAPPRTARAKLLSRWTSAAAAPGEGVLQPSEAQVHRWSTMIAAWDAEADRFWTRNNVFLTINGALFAVLAGFARDAWVVLAVSSFGFGLSLVWLRVNRVGKFYLDRWWEPIAASEAEWDIQPYRLMREASEKHPIGSRYKASTAYMLTLIRLVAALWLLVGAVSLGSELGSQLWGDDDASSSTTSIEVDE